MFKKICNKIKTHILYSIYFSENRDVYGIMWKNFAEPGRPQMTIWRIRIACWILMVTNRLSDYGTLIAFPQKQWLHELESILNYTHTAYFFSCVDNG